MQIKRTNFEIQDIVDRSWIDFCKGRQLFRGFDASGQHGLAQGAMLDFKDRIKIFHGSVISLVPCFVNHLMEICLDSSDGLGFDWTRRRLLGLPGRAAAGPGARWRVGSRLLVTHTGW